MAVPLHLAITGEKQGYFKGSCEKKGREGTILVHAFEHPITIPYNPENGQPSGLRRHKPLMFIKKVDMSSPKLHQALCSGERMKEVIFKWYCIDKNGVEEHYATTKLLEAVLVNIETYFPNTLIDSNASMEHMEKVEFTYRKIIWRNEKEGFESSDDFNG